jgi:hypothetical protein
MAAPTLVQESWCGDSMSFCRRDAPCAFLILGCGGGCGACGWLESGWNLISPPSWCLLVASFDPGFKEFGVRPRRCIFNDDSIFCGSSLCLCASVQGFPRRLLLVLLRRCPVAVAESFGRVEKRRV